MGWGLFVKQLVDHMNLKRKREIIIAAYVFRVRAQITRVPDFYCLNPFMAAAPFLQTGAPSPLHYITTRTPPATVNDRGLGRGTYYILF